MMQGWLSVSVFTLRCEIDLAVPARITIVALFTVQAVGLSATANDFRVDLSHTHTHTNIRKSILFAIRLNRHRGVCA